MQTGGNSTGGLERATLNALKWRYSGVVLQGLMQFGIGIVLARILTPEAFGLVGMALIAIGFGKLVGDFGFGAAIIQYPNLTDRHVQAALTATMLISVLFCIIVWLIAPTIAYFFGQDLLSSMLRVISLSLLFSGVGVTASAILRREFQFRLLTAVENCSYLIGFGAVGIAAAVAGFGAWSLVAASVVQPVCLAVMGLYVSKAPLRPYFGLQPYRDLLPFAFAEVTNNLVNYAGGNLHLAVIGKWLGASALGIFTRAYTVTDLPVRHFSMALGSVMFPIYAKIQNDTRRLGSAFLRTVSLTAIVTVPIFLSMAVVPDIIIGGLFGEQWIVGARAFQVLCLSGPLMAMMRVFGAVSHARGYIFSECGRQVLHFAVLSAMLWLLFPLGLVGAALAVTIATCVRYILLAQLSLKLVMLGWKEFLLANLPGYALGVITCTSAYFMAGVTEMLGTSRIIQMLIIGLTCALSIGTSLILLPTSWFRDVYLWTDRSWVNCPRLIRKLLSIKLSAVVSR